MADEYNRLAMYSAPVAPVENRLAQAVLPPGHPSNMLMWLRDQIPQVQADDTSTMSGITSRLGRTATAIPRAGLETMSNWLRGTHDPNAVRIGEDTIAPFGMFPMGMAGKGAAAARAAGGVARESDAAIAARLGEQYPHDIGGGRLSEQYIAGGPRIGVIGPDGMTPFTRTDGAIQSPREMGYRHHMAVRPSNDPAARTHWTQGTHSPVDIGRPANDLLSDNAKSSVPGTVVNANEPSESSGVGNFLYRNFVNATEPLTSDENEWAQEIMGSSRLAKEDRLRAAEQFGRSAGKAMSQWVDYLPQEQARKGLKHLFEKYGTGGPIEDIPKVDPKTQTPEDAGVLDILSRYGLY
jgi:hypothetical protein